MAAIKHKIKNGLAFTEDNILILNLFVFQLPENATVLNIGDHFKKFGEVLKLDIYGKKKTKKCVIYFADPRDAAKALQETCHVLLDHIIRVEPCHSFRQPDGEKFIKQLERACKGGLSEDDQQGALILTLNYDCLEHIYKELPPQDQLNFALTCLRFYNVMVMRSKVDYAHLKTSFFYEWTLWRTRIFLQIMGSQVTNLEVDILLENIKFCFLGTICTNVEKLVLHVHLDTGSLRKLIDNMQLLQELELHHVNFCDNFIPYFKAFKNLKSLSIQENLRINGSNMNLLIDLEKLSLAQCPRVTSHYFKEICESLKKLQYLDIRYCDLLGTEDFECILEHLLQLKILKLSVKNENFNCIAKLPKLKELDMMELLKGSITEEFLENLATYKANQLEVLKLELNNMNLKMASAVAGLKKLKILHCNSKECPYDEVFAIFSHLTELEEISLWDCGLITGQAILKILENCLKLKELDLKSCNRLTPVFLRNVQKLLEDQRARCLRTDPVHLILASNEYRDDMVNFVSPEDDRPDLMVVTFDCPEAYIDQSSDSDMDYYGYYDDDYYENSTDSDW